MASFVQSLFSDKQSQVVFFASTAIALYGYDQGMMSMVDTNYDYLATMGISEKSPLVGVIVSIYYLGCAVGAIIFSWWADRLGRKSALFACLATSSAGNLLMFVAGLGYSNGAREVMILGRIIMGLGVGGIDSVVPVYSSELSEDEARGKALAQEFQMNIFGLNMAFGINLGVTRALGKHNEWAWRIPVIVMQVFPTMLMALIELLPESPRWLIFHGRKDDAELSLNRLYNGDTDLVRQRLQQLEDANAEADANVSYWDMLVPGRSQFHPTVITVMGQINQALTGYGAVSVYGPQIFQLLEFGVETSEYLTQANYLSYLALMTFAWLLIDAVGRRALMLWNSLGLTLSFLVLTACAGLAQKASTVGISDPRPAGVLGSVALFIATGNFGIGWLATVWLIPTEIFPTTCRANGAAVSVVIWGIANFAVTLATPVMFNELSFWIFLIFAAANLFAGAWTYVYLPESGGRSFEENQRFFDDASKEGSWRVAKVQHGEYLTMPQPKSDDGETEPLLRRVRQQM